MQAGSQPCPSLMDQVCLQPPYFRISFIALVHRLGTQISSASLASPSRVLALISLILGEGRLGLSSFLIIQVCFWGGACLYFIYVQKRLLSD